MKKILTLFVFAFASVAVFASGEEDGHLHGPDGRHIVAPQGEGDNSSFILSHHDMRVEGEDGQVIEGVVINSTIYPKGEPDSPIHTELNAYEPENEVYGSHMTYKEPGEYVLSQDVEMPDGQHVHVDFPVFVPAVDEGSADRSGAAEGNPFLLIGGGLVGAVVIGFVAFRMGRSSAQSTSAGVFAFFVLVGVGLVKPAMASGEEDGHMHGPDGRHIVAPSAEKSSGPQLKAYPSADLGEMATKTVDGITFVLSIENEEIEPDLDLVAIGADQAQMIGLETATVESSSTAGGLQTTGRVSANPNGMVQVNTRAGGRIIQLGALPGTNVSRGQMLAVIESPELAAAQAAFRRASAEISQAEAGVKIAESSVVSAQTELKIAETTLDRQKRLAATGAFESPELEAAKSAVSQAQEDVGTSESRISALTSLLARQEEGVKSGVVARNDVEMTKAELAEARTELADARIQLSLARGKLDREESIAQQGLRNAQEIQSSEADVELARASLTSSQNRLAQAQADLTRVQSSVRVARDQIALLGGRPAGGNRITVTAPISAEVEHRFVSVGQTVAVGELLYDLLNADIVWVLADIFESDINKIEVGQSIEVVADAHPDHVYTGQVSFIHNEVNPDTRTTPVRIVIDNPGERLKQNMFVQVILGTSEGAQTVVPSAAIQNDGGLDVVFVEEVEGTYRKTIVQVLGSVGNRTIVRGLDPGQTVATNGAYQLLSLGDGQ